METQQSELEFSITTTTPWLSSPKPQCIDNLYDPLYFPYFVKLKQKTKITDLNKVVSKPYGLANESA